MPRVAESRILFPEYVAEIVSNVDNWTIANLYEPINEQMTNSFQGMLESTPPPAQTIDIAVGPNSVSTWILTSSSTGASTVRVVGDTQNRIWARHATDSTWQCLSTNPTSIITSTNGSAYFTSTLTSSTTINTTGIWTTATNNWVHAQLHDQLGQYKKEVRGPAIKKSTRSSIKRALKLMTGLGFEEDVRIFLSGDSIEVSHPDSLLKFVITKYRDSLIRRTEYPGYSTPYKLELYTKSDVHVANLCVYMEETPLLDQVMGVAMFIQSGSEEMILRQANWSSLSNDRELREILALEYPYLKQKLRLNS